MHAATMVAAGVYMCVRLFPIFTPGALTVIAYIGAITAILAAITAITQNDIKKVLAYSTVSQLGDLVVSYFKRLSNVKNTGKIIPGHGGILDRTDGMIFAFPFSYILSIFNFV